MPVPAETAEAVLTCLAAYLCAGALFALVFLWRGVEMLDPAARGTGAGFRLILLPGTLALWPVLALRWLLARAPAGGHPASREGAP
ncbi:MAG: hypothetical protein HXY25_08345 [Alphaproteobacteria bacterium]|nr:hypothetical protein [Alphaproteobacteria bacterium]